MVDSRPRYLSTMNEEGNTSANHKPMSARDAVTGAIVRRLSLADWWLLVVATAAQLGVAAGLRIMPLSAWRRHAGAWRSLAQCAVRGSNQRIAWAIDGTPPGRPEHVSDPRARRRAPAGRPRGTDDADDRGTKDRSRRVPRARVACARGSRAGRRDERRVPADGQLDGAAQVSGPLQDRASVFEAGSALQHRYGVYGIRVLSDALLDLPEYADDSLACVEC